MLSIKLGKPFGIPLIVTGLLNILLLLLFFGVLSINLYDGKSILESLLVAGGTILVWVILFTVVTLHEYGHSLMAKRLGYHVPKILLHPLGGAAMIEGDWCKHAKHEFLITICGPAVNLFLAILTAPWISYSPYLALFFIINTVLLVFNILPIYPMDGGRMIRSSLTALFKGNWWLATKWSWGIGIVATLTIIPLAVMYQAWLAAIIIGLVTFILAPLEIKQLYHKLLEDEVVMVNGRHQESEHYEWMSQIAYSVVVQILADPSIFGLEGDKRSQVRQFTERCWKRLDAGFDQSHQAWLDKGKKKPHSIVSRSFLTILALPPKTEDA